MSISTIRPVRHYFPAGGEPTHGVLSYDTVLGRVGLDDLELDGTHTTSDEEGVSLPDGSVSSSKVERVDVSEHARSITVGW